MKKSRAISALMGASILMAAPAQQVAVAEEAAAETAQAESFDKIANVQGAFSYNQNVMTPPDEVFSLFGTAATGICATPSFALGNAETQDIYINIRGTMKKAATVSLDVLKEQGGTSTVMACSCGMSGAVANTKVTGVLLEDVIGLQDIIKDVNTVTVRDKDGYGLSLPLSYVLEKQAMLVWSVGDTELTSQTGDVLMVKPTISDVPAFNQALVSFSLLVDRNAASGYQRTATLTYYIYGHAKTVKLELK